MPGAPKKSPAVSLTRPKPALVLQGEPGVDVPQLLPTAPGPWERLIRLRRLNISACNRILTRSVIGMFLKTDKSTVPWPGPTNLLRERLPMPDAGKANAA